MRESLKRRWSMQNKSFLRIFNCKLKKGINLVAVEGTLAMLFMSLYFVGSFGRKHISDYALLLCFTYITHHALYMKYRRLHRPTDQKKVTLDFHITNFNV